jgi:hypothetical protein
MLIGPLAMHSPAVDPFIAGVGSDQWP